MYIVTIAKQPDKHQCLNYWPHLEAAGICEERSLPVHEVVKAADFGQRSDSRPHAEVIGVT